MPAAVGVVVMQSIESEGVVRLLKSGKKQRKAGGAYLKNGGGYRCDAAAGNTGTEKNQFFCEKGEGGILTGRLRICYDGSGFCLGWRAGAKNICTKCRQDILRKESEGWAMRSPMMMHMKISPIPFADAVDCCTY